MNRLFNTTNIVRHFKFRWTIASAYRGSLITTTSWQTDRTLHVLLWAGIGLMTVITCQQVQAMWASSVITSFSQPPKQSSANVNVMQKTPELRVQRNHRDSLFNFSKQVPIEQPEELPKLALTEKVPVKPKTIILKPQWQLQLQKSITSEVSIQNSLVSANNYLQSGQFELAKKVMQDMLLQDLHRVEILEELLFISRKTGDIQSEEEYLERIRQEIPDYSQSDVSFINIEE